MSVIDGKEVPMPQHQLLIQMGLTANDLLALCFSEKQIKNNQHFVFLTHLFVHQSYGHLLSNVYGLFTASRALSYFTGGGFIYFVFFTGGTLSAVPTFLREMQLLNSAKSTLGLPESMDYLPNTINDAYRRFRESASRGTANAMRPLVHTMGSSGAVCALSGAGLVFDLRSLLLELFPSTRSKQASTSVKIMIRSSINAALSLYYLYGQVQAVRGKGAIKISNIDFAAHVQGFTVGAVLALGYIFWNSSRKIKKTPSTAPSTLQ